MNCRRGRCGTGSPAAVPPRRKRSAPDGRYLAIADVSAGVRVYDLDTGGEVIRWHPPDAGPVRLVRFTPSGGLAVLPRSGTAVRVLDVDAMRNNSARSASGGDAVMH